MDVPNGDKQSTPSRWAVVKDRLAIAAVILVVLIGVFMMIDSSIVNYQCRLSEFLTFQCNRWEALFPSR